MALDALQPRFSPDGSEIVYTSDADGADNIWIMETDGSNARAVTSEKFRLLNNPSWSPDGTYIAARKHYTTVRSLGTGEIWIYHRNGGSGVAVVEKPLLVLKVHIVPVGLLRDLPQTEASPLLIAQVTQRGDVFRVTCFGQLDDCSAEVA